MCFPCGCRSLCLVWWQLKTRQSEMKTAVGHRDRGSSAYVVFQDFIRWQEQLLWWSWKTDYELLSLLMRGLQPEGKHLPCGRRTTGAADDHWRWGRWEFELHCDPDGHHYHVLDLIKCNKSKGYGQKTQPVELERLQRALWVIPYLYISIREIYLVKFMQLTLQKFHCGFTIILQYYMFCVLVYFTQPFNLHETKF